MPPKKVWLSWSSGKDSAFALYVLSQSAEFEVTGLFSTITHDYGRVSMHGVREILLDQQARQLGLPIYKAYIPAPCSNDVYKERMGELIKAAHQEDVEVMAFGDLFLEDIRAYRINQLNGTGIAALFPVWGRETSAFARAIIDTGLGAVVTCVDEKKLAPEFSGRLFDEAFINDLPSDVDPCGENGEFHSFVYQHPLFKVNIAHTIGQRTSREGFTFTDILPYERPSSTSE